MKRWCVKHNQACDYANSNGDCNVSACQTVIGGDRKMTNREWLESLSDEGFSSQLNGAYCESMERICFGTCDYRCYKFDKNELTTVWLKQEHKENSDDK